jgi:hypothetical protein
VAPASANTEPAELKYRVRRTKPYDTNNTPIVAIRNASGTARPICPATAVPLSAIAAVGAMIASDSAIASTKRSSRRRPRPSRAGRVSVVMKLAPPWPVAGREQPTPRGGGKSKKARECGPSERAILGSNQLD